jgi:hypothetical protein
MKKLGSSYACFYCSLPYSSQTTDYDPESVFHFSTIQAVCDILRPHLGPEKASHPGVWKTLKSGLDLLPFIDLWGALEIASGDTECLLNEASILELSLLAARAKCLLPHDRVYGVLGLLPSSMSSAVTIDYSREVTAVMAEFSSAVPEWSGL